MIVAIYDAGGVAVLYMDATQELVELNVPAGGHYEEITPQRMSTPAEAEDAP